MCLAVAGKIIQLDELNALVDIEGNQVKVTTVLVPEVKLGDCVLIHTGFAISVLSEEDYREHQRLMKEIEEYAQSALTEDE